jgi:hypothetical protein
MVTTVGSKGDAMGTRRHSVTSNLVLIAALVAGPLVLAPAASASSVTRAAGSPTTYVVDFVSTAAFGVDMNDVGDVTGTSYLDTGCGSSCLPPLETVVWRGGKRIVLPAVPGLTGIYVRSINAQGWVAGLAGFPGTTTHAVVWKPTGTTYEALDLGTLPGTTSSEAVGIDDTGRVIGWSTSLNFPPSGSPFLWTEANGMVDLSAQGYPDEKPLAISPHGTVALSNGWYRLGDPTSVTPLAPPPPGFFPGVAVTAINDAGDQASFLTNTGPENLVYLFRYHHEGSWQQLSNSPTGHLSTYGVGSINDAGDLTATVTGTGVIAYGPDGLAQPLASLVSPAYQGGPVTSVGPINASGRILAQIFVGQSPRLVRLTPGAACGAACIRVANVEMVGKGPAFCDQGRAVALARVTVTDEAGTALSGVRVAGHLMDDYWMDHVVAGQTNAQGRVTFRHSGPPCVGAIAFLVSSATKAGRSFDRTTGVLTDYVIPLP